MNLNQCGPISADIPALEEPLRADRDGEASFSGWPPVGRARDREREREGDADWHRWTAYISIASPSGPFRRPQNRRERPINSVPAGWREAGAELVAVIVRPSNNRALGEIKELSPGRPT